MCVGLIVASVTVEGLGNGKCKSDDIIKVWAGDEVRSCGVSVVGVGDEVRCG